METIDDTQMFHQQQQEHQQWLEREYDIAFGSFAQNFKEFVASHEEVYKKAKEKELLYMGAYPEYGDK